MPTIEELDTFKKRYNELGDEPRVLEERGESLEDVIPPDTSPDLELESLLDDVETDNGSEEMEALLGGYSDEFSGSPADAEDTLGIEGLDDIGITEDIDEADILAATDQPLEVDDIGDLSDLGIAEESAETIEADAVEVLDDLGIAEELGDDEEPAGIDDFGDLGLPGEAAEPGISTEPAGVEDLSDLGDIGDLGDLGVAEEPGETVDGDTLEGLDDLGIAGEPTETVDADAVEVLDDLGIAEELGDDEEPAGIDDFGDLGLPEEIGEAAEPGISTEPAGVEDLSDLGDIGDLGIAEESGETVEADAIEGLDDLGIAEGLGDDEEPAGLDDLGDLGLPEEIGEPAEPGISTEPAGVEDLSDLGVIDDLGDLGVAEETAETVEADAIEGLDDLGDLGLPEEPGEPAEPGAATEPAGVDDFSDLGDIGDLGDLGIAEEPAEIVEADTLEGLDDLGIAEELGDDEEPAGLDDLGDLGLPEEPGEPVESGAATEPAGVEDLSDLGDLGDLGDFGIAEGPAETVEADTLEGLDDLGIAEELGDDGGPADTDVFGDLDLAEEPTESAEFGEGMEFGADENLAEIGIGEESPAPGDAEEMPEFDLSEEIGESLEIGDVAAEIEPTGGSDEPGDIGDSGLPEIPGDIGDLAEIDELDELPDIGELDETDDSTEGDALDIPDVGAAMDGLGEAAEGDDFSAGELTLDEELNLDEELGEDVLTDMRETGEETQQFSLDDFGEQYNFIDDDTDLTTDIGVDLDKLEKSIEEAEGEEKPFQLDDDEFAAVKGALAELPLNLKVAIEEMLASERQSPENAKILVGALLDGASPKELVDKVYRISRRRIELPRGYGKRTGVAFESLRTTFAYRFAHEGWPVLRIVLAVIAVTWIIAMAAFSFIYRPLKARSLYNAGMGAIAVDDIPKSRELFDNAWYGWPLFIDAETVAEQIEPRVVVKGWADKEWLLRYAQEYRRRKHWPDAEKMYRHYLVESPDQKGVRLEYADFLSLVLGRYGDAVELIKEGQQESVNLYDKDLLLALGDVYLRWGEDEPRKYEEARFQYAKALEIHGALEEVTLRMLRYFLTIQDEEEVDRLLGLFSNEKPGKTRVPRLAAEVYSRVGDYYLDRNLLMDARRFVDLALAADPYSPNPWFTEARYQRMMGEPNDELNAYRQVLVNLEGSEAYSNDDLRMRILTHANIGRLRSEDGQDRDSRRRARKAYLEAVELYEDAVERNLLGSSPEYAEIFVGLGDLYYRGIDRTHDLKFSLDYHPEAFSSTGDSDMESALRYYERASQIYGRDRVPTETRYRRGYARYVLENDGGYEEVLRDFHQVARDLPANHDVRYSLASVLMKREDYEAARSQYVRTLELLEDSLTFSGGVLDPVNSPGHQDLLVRFVGAWNNLGVARARSAARTGDEESFAAALAAFARSSEFLDRSVGDSALRDVDNEDRRIIEPAEGRRTLKEKTTIPYLNRQYLLFPSDDITYSSGDETFTMDEFIPYENIPGYVTAP